VESFRQNNFTADLASDFISADSSSDDGAYWLGLQAYNDLQTNTLQADEGKQISQYYGHWAEEHPDVLAGKCVRSVLNDGKEGQVRKMGKSSNFPGRMGNLLLVSTPKAPSSHDQSLSLR